MIIMSELYSNAVEYVQMMQKNGLTDRQIIGLLGLRIPHSQLATELLQALDSGAIKKTDSYRKIADVMGVKHPQSVLYQVKKLRDEGLW